MRDADPQAFSLPSLHHQVLFDVVDENVKLSHSLVDSVLVHLQVKARSKSGCGDRSDVDRETQSPSPDISAQPLGATCPSSITPRVSLP